MARKTNKIRSERILEHVDLTFGFAYRLRDGIVVMLEQPHRLLERFARHLRHHNGDLLRSVGSDGRGDEQTLIKQADRIFLAALAYRNDRKALKLTAGRIAMELS